MPELAELKLSAQYVNQQCEGRTFTSIEKNPVHKGLEMEKPFEEFYIKATSRGKEMLLILYNADKTVEMQAKTMKFTFGMSGHFKMTKTGEERKHSHLMFKTDDGYTLSFVDVRRFGKWKWDGWNKGRGFDPTQNYEEFRNDIMNNLQHKLFDKPICEVLLNQRYFNGIGNYLRAEILFKTKQNPFESARDAIKNNPKILDYCNKIPLEAYVLGGGQLKQWENPFNVSPTKFQKWMMCYGNKEMKQTVDGTGRRLWFDPMWEVETIS